jgi:hypothetical protein
LSVSFAAYPDLLGKREVRKNILLKKSHCNQKSIFFSGIRRSLSTGFAGLFQENLSIFFVGISGHFGWD